MSGNEQKRERNFLGGGAKLLLKKWWFWAIVVVAVAALAFTDTPEDKSESEPIANRATDQPKETDKPQESEKPTEQPKVTEPTQSKKEEKAIKYDKLQQLYLDIDPKFSYSKMVACVKGTKLPYSEEKNNGSRTIQVAFTEGCTAQSHKKENGDYLKIIYVYAENQNSGNDDLKKYSIGTISYCPSDSDLELISHYEGTYFSCYDAGNYISNFGTMVDIDKEISRKEQLTYYFENK